MMFRNAPEDYGYHQGNLLWRGRFDSSSISKIQLTVAGGWGSAFSVWLNGHHLGSVQSLGSDFDELSETFKVGRASMKEEGNVVTILQGACRHVSQLLEAVFDFFS